MQDNLLPAIVLHAHMNMVYKCYFGTNLGLHLIALLITIGNVKRWKLNMSIPSCSNDFNRNVYSYICLVLKYVVKVVMQC